MNDDQRKHLEERLLEERDRVLDTLRHASPDDVGSESGGDLSRVPQHMADRGTDTIDSEIEGALSEQEYRTLRDIDAALDLIRRDPERYGRSEVSGDAIPMERLEVVPWARRLSSEEE
jgi:RNA polymerase-binding transcription factor DksA